MKYSADSPCLILKGAKSGLANRGKRLDDYSHVGIKEVVLGWHLQLLP